MKISAMKFTSTDSENVTTSVEVPTLLIDSTVSMNSENEMIQLNSVNNDFTTALIAFVNSNNVNEIYVEATMTYPELGVDDETSEPLITKNIKNLVGCSSIFIRTINGDTENVSFAMLTFTKRQISGNHAGGITMNSYPVSFEILSENSILMHSLLPSKK